MTSEVLRLGPFVGGLNRRADPVVIGDEELIDCLNLELDTDGSLVNRPPIQVIIEGSSDDRLLIFGSVEFSGVTYLFATRSGATFVSSNLGTSWSELNPGALSRECVCMVVYQNKVWMPATPNSANGGISWDPTGGAVSESAMPRAVAAVVHKNRLYLCPGRDGTNESRLFFSAAADFTTWPGTNFIDVAQGDGTALNNLVVYQDNLLLFKGESTHVLAYDLDPVDAILREINSVVGSHGHLGVVQHENTVYCMHHNNVYAIVNFNFQLINLKVPFEHDEQLPANTSARYEDQHLSLFGNRLIVRFFNRTYVLGLRTGTWSEWRKTDSTSTVEWHVFGPLIRAHEQHGTGIDEYYTAYSFDMNDASGYKIFKIRDDFSINEFEGFGENLMHCIATTKDYDMADPVRYKRLFWWGADIKSGNQITADVRPITLVSSPTWDELGTLTWDQLGTWDSLIDEPIVTRTIVAADNKFNTNKMIKFLKSLRFRKINFSVMLETNGSSAQINKIFSYLAVVRTKQTVSKEAS